jgi:hypothetical protein
MSFVEGMSCFYYKSFLYVENLQMDLEFGFESLRRDALLRTLVRNSYRYHRNEILATVINEYVEWDR